MFKSLRSLFISFTIVTFILFSTVGTTTAYADDDDGTGTDTTETETTGGSEEEQPSEPIAEETPPPTEEESSSDVVVDVTPAPTEEGQPEEETDLSSEETIVEDESLGTIMEQVPDNTTLTVLNSEGEALPLASQESADAIQSAYDPIWCPAGQVPTPGANGCTQSFDSFDELLTFLQANEVDVAYQQAGTIYIQQGAYLGGETSIDFNNYNFNQINNHNLTLQGGWDTTYDPNVNGDPTYTTTTFDVPIIIGSDTNPWAGSLTINNISINGVSNQSGLMLHSDSDINLDNVAVTNSQSGAELNAGGNVKVNNSKFNNNGSGNIEDPVGKGLDIVSGGNVSLASVEGNNNQLFGTNIQTVGAVVVLNSFFNGNKSYTFSSSTGTTTYFGYGIQVFTNSEVSFVEVEATENYLYGAYIDGKDVAVDTANFSNNGSGSGTDLTGSGLQVVSDFEVALAGVTADNNQLFGADITAGDLVAIERSSFNGHLAYIDGSTITYILGYSTEEAVDRTGGYGLRVVTLGNIAVEDVTANNNYLYGAYLEGDDTAVEGNVTGSSFVGNGSGIISVPTGNDYGYGLKIVSTGSVSLYNINDANSAGNQLFGADISAVQDVTIVNSFFSGNQSVAITPEMDMTFYGYGLTVVTPGDITLNYVVANHNNLWGGSLTGNNVEIGNSQFNNNISDSNVFIDDTGLLVNAQGNVDIFNSEANENRLIGADIKAEGDVFIEQSNFNFNRGYTCQNEYSLSQINDDWCPQDSISYHGYGLKVTTPGLIQVLTTNANYNLLFGAELNGALIIVEDSFFNNNGMDNGLTINASDNVTLTNIAAQNNGGNGVEVTGVCDKTVQVNGGTFTDNSLFGLRVLFATLILDGTQTFGGNGSGDYTNILTDPADCIVVTPVSTTTETTEIVTTNPNTTNDEQPTDSEITNEVGGTEAILAASVDNENSYKGTTGGEELTTNAKNTDQTTIVVKISKKSYKMGMHKGFDSTRQPRRG